MVLKQLRSAGRLRALIIYLLTATGCHFGEEELSIMTVNGPVSGAEAGRSLIHEHVLVDFIGADSTGYHRWSREEAFEIILPFIEEEFRIRYHHAEHKLDCPPTIEHCHHKSARLP